MELILSIEANLAARSRDWLDTSLRARSPFHGTPETSCARLASLRHNVFVLSTTESIPRAGSTRRRARAEQRRALCLDPDQIAVGVASRLVPGKGHDVAIRAFAAVADRLPRARLLVAGDGPFHAEVERRRWHVGTFRRVKSASWGSSMTSEASSARVTLCCSRRCRRSGRGSGWHHFEAMAAGVPVVASDAGPLPEIVSDGESGLVVAAGDDEAWAEAIFALASDSSLRHRLGNEARARACHECSVDQMADRTVAVYREVVSEHGAPGHCEPGAGVTTFAVGCPP